MNPFLCDFNHRMQAWKQCRQQVQAESDCDAKLDACLQFWKQAPEESVRLDWDNCANWPQPWDLLYENSYCSSCHSLGIAYTLLLADPHMFGELKLQLIWSKSHHIQKVVPRIQDVYLNVGWFDKVAVDKLNDCVVQDTWTWTQKKWQSVRPK